ncbi:hypothetical protein IMCC3088_1858 [Aequoribacter fuscus]|uniref:Uncharacterized protein n=1 Tax=Aequoribacter fuscus TaxID=2518989 RepID=F3L2T4_9GAMM|nr:GIY-YIG nuclease family protein [Aequoribacter fuscus]EGG29402.1 hypothetical protein IMCC3088_1858 [Aequoribacter fuscus]QHJ87561.1 GIY-YIG nuclease family protein [Aequoribacter fuscus]
MAGRYRTIQIYLPNGDPTGIRIAELTTSIIRVIEIPRSQITQFLKSEEANQVGFYFLFGGDSKDEVYIGQSGNLGSRLSQHSKDDKRDWERALAVVSLTNNLTQTHVLYLESLSIERAKACDRYRVINGNGGQRPHTPIPLRDDCDEIHEIASLLMATLGYPIFEKLVDESNENEREIFYCTRTGANAQAVYTNEGLVVLKGSTGLLNPNGKSRADLVNARDRLIESGVLAVEGEFTRFTKDWLFSTPSGASNAVVVMPSNGWREWKTASGITLDELHRSGPANE